MTAANVHADPRSIRIARDFVARISRDYRVEQAWLYGSRVKGDALPDSDLDLALVVGETREEARRLGSYLAGEAIDELLSFGVLISPLVIARSDWDRPENFPNPFLLHNVRQEGVRL